MAQARKNDVRGPRLEMPLNPCNGGVKKEKEKKYRVRQVPRYNRDDGKCPAPLSSLNRETPTPRLAPRQWLLLLRCQEYMFFIFLTFLHVP